ncbi:TRP-domain-containing protein [Panus rudis PR-1116 ss-1]|nr:TRP-domain-containing protein [Panus rudis PR-1116 ss-1]
MFFSVAWLRLSLLAAFLLSVHARDESLFTSSVSYCAPPESLLIQQFDIAYIASNRSVNFNVSAASVLPNINVTANLLVNVYGMRPLNLSLDLCNLLNGALCPLPTYNFTGADSITLPSSVDVGFIPGIAYKIPDLEAFAQLTLTEVGTGKVRACVQSTLSNGWSTRQKAVEWSTGAMALLALLSAVAQSFIPTSLAPVRLLDVISLFQTIAVTGLWGLNYPSVYRAYTSNFSWALGLFPQSATSSMQQSIDRMRQHTGGQFDGSGGSAISLVNRRLSPYNDPPTLLSLSARAAEYASSADTSADVSNGTFTATSFLVGGNVQTVTSDSANVLQAGLPIYVNSIGIATANAFMTIFFVVLILLAIVLAALGLGYLVLLGLSRTSWGRRREQKLDTAISAYPAFAQAWGLRMVLVILLPVLVFAFYQWTLKDSWVSVLFSVILLIAVLGALGYACFVHFRRYRAGELEEERGGPSPVEPLTAPYRTPRAYYVYVVLVAILAKSLITAFAKAHGMIQAILILVIEFLLFVSLIIAKPHPTRGSDVLSGYLNLTRLVCTGLTIAFAESIGLAPIPRVAIGIVIAVIFSVSVVVMFFNVLVNLGLWALFRRALGLGRRQEGARSLSSMPSSGSQSSLEKGSKTNEKTYITPASSSSHFYTRPTNPSPSHTPTTASILSPMSAVSYEPTATSATTTTTLGETLPRRWSFQHSRPPSSYTPVYADSPMSTTDPSARVSMYTSTNSDPRYSRRISGDQEDTRR